MDWTPQLHAMIRLATQSADPRTQNAAGLYLADQIEPVAQAVNGLVPGEWGPSAWLPELKPFVVEHAERGALYHGDRERIDLSQATLVCPWAACADCARAIVLCGVRTVVSLPWDESTPQKWRETCRMGDEILLAGGVRVMRPKIAPAGVALRRDGKMIIL